ncbi:MAG: hypothetical protein WAL41_02590 [Mycobacterium sp.]
MSEQKEIRVLHVEVPDPQPGGGTVELRPVNIVVAFSDGNWTQTKAFISMKHQPSANLIEMVKNFVTQIERA